MQRVVCILCLFVCKQMAKHALSFSFVAECSVSKARACKMVLPHAVVDTPVFMPVGTQGTLKGLTSEQLDDLGCRIVLGNTYHLGNRPVCKICYRLTRLGFRLNVAGLVCSCLLCFKFLLTLDSI